MRNSEALVTKISIAMATYNGAKYIRQQLESIAAQTLRPIEIIICDDRSTDDTRTIIQEFATNSPIPVVLHLNDENLGFRANFFKCAALCTGNLVQFSDQDDIWLPQKLEKAAAYFSDPEVMMVHHNVLLFNDVYPDIGALATEPPQSAIADKLTLPPWIGILGFTQLFRRELCNTFFAWPKSTMAEDKTKQMVHDQWITFVANSVGKVAYIHQPLARYRQHTSNTIGWSVEKTTFLKKMRHRLENRSAVYLHLADASHRRATALLEIADALPMQRTDLEFASAKWIDLSRSYTKRSAVYGEGAFSTRLSAMTSLTRSGFYNERGFWTVGRNGAIKDLVLGVALGPLVRRYGYVPTGGDQTCRRGEFLPSL
jgi:glycosyltransferase involved in cell wall biosynthesis